MVSDAVLSLDTKVKSATDFVEDMGALADTLVAEVHEVDSEIAVAAVSTESAF